eukprot:NODE_62_length_26495_cov_0.832853.p13 type:complete len:261 gc:universal NODE_62_length_26495_cov_0.832853:26179-25397(-)
MLEARFAKGGEFKKIFEAIREIVNEGNFDCSQSGIAMQAMDSSHVALVALMLRAEGFEPFRCDQPMSLGMSFVTLTKILKCASNDDSITMFSESDKTDKLGLIFEDTKNDKVSEYEVKLITLDSEHLSIPDQKFQAQVSMSSSEFQKIIRDLGSLGETIYVDVDKGAITFRTSGSDGSGTIKLKPPSELDEDASPLDIDLDAPVSLGFSTKYLANVTKATPLSNTVKLSLMDGSPMLVEYVMEDVGYIRFYLAPKLEGEE